MTTATHQQAPRGTPERREQPERAPGHYRQDIIGRFRRITTHQLVMAWWLHAAGHITRRQLRVYFAAHEMAERRRYTSEEHQGCAAFGLEELKRLVGGRGSSRADRDLTADIRHLARIGLVTIEERSIAFATSVEHLHVDDDLQGFWEMMRSQLLQNRRRVVPVPRRTLRALAAGFRRGATAYVLAALIRSVFWHKNLGGGEGSYRVDGRMKLSEVEAVFQVSRRALTEARAELIDNGWLEPLEVHQRILNRWGVHDVVNVSWSPTEDHTAVGGELEEGSRTPSAPESRSVNAVGETWQSEEQTHSDDTGSASPHGQDDGGSASPYRNRYSSSSRNLRTRRLGAQAPDPSGVWISSKENQGSREGKKTRPRSSVGDSGLPSIRDVRIEHLREPETLLELHRQAVEVGLARDCVAGQLEFLSFANRARMRGTRPGALLMWLLKEHKTEFITTADEEAATQHLREIHYGKDARPPDHQGGCGGRGSTAPPVEFTDEEQIVQVCLRVAQQHRVADPFRVVQQHPQAKAWTREQWDDAALRFRVAQVQRTVDAEEISFR